MRAFAHYDVGLGYRKWLRRYYPHWLYQCKRHKAQLRIRRHHRAVYRRRKKGLA